MKIEHKLSPAMAGAVARVLDQIRTLETERLTALGRAKESEMAMFALRQALGEQLSIVQQTEGLPAPIEPYRLNAEGNALVGEIAEPAGVPGAPVVELAPVAPRSVNGI